MADDVIFKLNADLTDRQREALLSRVKALPGVVAAAAVRPNATSAAGRGLCFARIEAGADAEKLAAILQGLPEIDHAEIPPKRTIAGD